MRKKWLSLIEMEGVRRQRVIRAVLFLLPALIYLPTLGRGVAYPPGQGTFTDLLVTHYPNLLYLRDSLLGLGQLPLWSNMIMSGAPFAANPLSGLFYLPGWIALLFPLPAGLSLVAAGHVVFGTWGMYRLLRLEKVGEQGSVLGALAFGLMPKAAAHFGAGHLSLIYAISWTPWLLSCSQLDREGWRTGLVAGCLFLADPRWAIYAGLLWLSYDFAHRQQNFKDRFTGYLKAALSAVLIAAPLLIPLLEFVQNATRSALTSEDLLKGSMPARQLLGLLIPGSGGNLEWYCYSGGAAAALLIYLFFNKELRAKNRYWLAWWFLGILFSLGTLGLDLEWIQGIPVLNLLRVPARSLFITAIALSVLAGKALDQITTDTAAGPGNRRIYFAVFGLGLLMSLGLTVLAAPAPSMLAWGFSFLALGGFVLFIKGWKPIQGHLSWIITLLCLLDVIGAGWASYELRERDLGDSNPALAFLTQQEGQFRIYSPSYSIEQHLVAEKNLEIADGIDPMQIAAYAEFMAEAAGVEPRGYSVTIPPFDSGEPSWDNQGAEPAPALLGLLNVKYIMSDFEIQAPGLVKLDLDGGGALYLNQMVYPRAWIEPLGQNQLDLDPSTVLPVKIDSWGPNRIQLEAVGPGRLVISEIFYPGWKVLVNGQQAEIEISHRILRSVMLPAGTHQVAFIFRPLTVYAGLVLAGAGWLLLLNRLYRKKS